eukprot:s2887_g3.t1
MTNNVKSPRSSPGQVGTSGVSDKFLPGSYVDERLLAEKVGNRIAIKSANYMNKYVKMHSTFDIVTTTQVGEWEKFQVVLVEHPLKQFIGQTIGLYNIDWFRFLRMRNANAGGVDGSPESHTREVMPKNWYDCKFTVVDAGNNKVALHNHKHSRFLKMESITRSNFAECPPPDGIFPMPTEHTITEIDVLVTDTVDSNAVPASALPSSWHSAMFEVKSPGWGAEASNSEHGPHVALYASGVGRYVRMHQTFCCQHDDSGICMGPASTVGLHDKGSYFKVVGTFHQLVEPYVGRSLALHNVAHNVFLKMENDVLTTSPTKAANDFPEGWHSEKFTVVDARRGLVGNLGSGGGGGQMPEPWRKTGRKASEDHYLGLTELAVVEAAAYHEDGTRMGHLLLQLLRSDPLGGDSDGGKSWGGVMLAVEDPYYSWWFESTFGALKDGKEVFFHFCRQPQHSCSFRGGYADLIHVDVWRILMKDEVLSTRWLRDGARAQVEQLLRAPPGNLTAPASPSGDVQPGAAGITGLRSALEGTPLEEGADAKAAGKRKRKQQPDAVNEEHGDKKAAREDSDDSASYGEILRRRKPLAQAESALKLRRTKKKKKTSKKKDKKPKSDSDESSDESTDGSVFRVAPLPEGIDRLKRTHLKQPGRLADLTLQRYRELLMRSTGRGAELVEQDKMPSVARAYLQQVQRTTREMRTLMLVVDYLTMNMVPSALDVLLQRQKALELSAEQQSWLQANHLELVDMEEARSYFTQELKAAQSEVKAEQKLGKGWSPSYRPSQGWRPPAPPASGVANKENKDGDAAPTNEEPRKGKKGKKGKGRGRW